MKLHFTKFGSGRPLLILHGVFGSSDNWKTIGNALSAQHEVYLIDQRNHGLSPHSDAFNYQLMTADLLALMDREGIDQADLMGHSMGGKTVMNFATLHPDRVVQLVVVDIAPKYYPPHHENIFAGFHSLVLDEMSTRKEADTKLAQTIKEPVIRQFLLKNLHRELDGTFSWKINFEAIEKNMYQIGAALRPDQLFEGPTLFLRGANSDYIEHEDERLLKTHFPNAKLVSIAGAGHWIHAEQPEILKRTLENFLTK